MSEKPTEDTYVAEFISVIKEVGRALDFDAEANWRSPSGKPDIKLYYRSNPVAIIEVKRPEILLSDPGLNVQALKYAEWYRNNQRIHFYGIHNMRYLKIFRYVPRGPSETPLDYISERRMGVWVPVSDFPFQIMPWVKSINEYKQISVNRSARENVETFLLKFKEILEGRALDLSRDTIHTIRSYIEEGASKGLTKFEDLYRNNVEVRKCFEDWLKERGLEKPRNDSELRDRLMLMLKEQLYTFSLKVLFYMVLQSIDADMATKLRENLSSIDVYEAQLFKSVFDMLFNYAIEKTGDFNEIFGTNVVERLPIPEPSLPSLKQLLSYLNQIRWSEVNVDVIGRIFEGLIHEERRHLLGQHYTDTKIVDLILTATLNQPGRLLDPACGSGTFLVRALNLWRIRFGLNREVYELVEGVDIDKLASMLSKINLYIQALEEIKKGYGYNPKIHHGDFFKVTLSPGYSYVVTNPPYTRQEEMAMAFYDGMYKENLMRAVSDIPNWDKRASIYAYFLIRGGKMLKEGGRLGFVIENSWMNAEYGIPIKKWFMENFAIRYVVESLVEKWFEDAEVITNIIVAEKERADHITRFLFLKKPLQKLIGDPPPSIDYTANQKYYENIERIYSYADSCNPEAGGYSVLEDEDIRVVAVRKDALQKLEERLGKWGIFRGPKTYFKLVFEFIEGNLPLVLLKDIVGLYRGLTTNANELFYLPSEYWRYRAEDENYLELQSTLDGAPLKLEKSYLKPLIRPAHIRDLNYRVDRLPKKRKEDYVIWLQNVEEADKPGIRRYIEWCVGFVQTRNKTNGSFSTLIQSLNKTSWTQLSDTSGAVFMFKNAVYKNFAVHFNTILDAQIDLRLYGGRPRGEYKEIDSRIMTAILNSVLTYIGMEVIGRTNLGQGALDIKVTDYNYIPVVDPVWLKNELDRRGETEAFLKIVEGLLSARPANIEEEAQRLIRLQMEKYMLQPLGLNITDIKDLYQGLIQLVKFRTERARKTQ